jgi:hypothetical protein
MPCPSVPRPPALFLSLPSAAADWFALAALIAFFAFLGAAWRKRDGRGRPALHIVIGASAACAFATWLLSSAVYDPWLAHALPWENAQLRLLPGNCFTHYNAILTGVQSMQTRLDQAINILSLAALAILLIPGSLLLVLHGPRGRDIGGTLQT